MKPRILFLILFLCTVGTGNAMPDLSLKEEDIFQKKIGEHVIVTGILKESKEGCCLDGLQMHSIGFNLRLSRLGTAFSWPESLTRKLNHRVKVTGVLKYFSIPQTSEPLPYSVPPNCYYMYVKHENIKVLDRK